jgi:hypothetical protein
LEVDNFLRRKLNRESPVFRIDIHSFWSGVRRIGEKGHKLHHKMVAQLKEQMKSHPTDPGYYYLYDLVEANASRPP